MKTIIGPCPLGSHCERVENKQGEQILVRCPWYIQLRGKDPQSEKELDEWRCSIAWFPILQIEGAQQTRQAGAAIESFRNEMVRQNNDLLQLNGGGIKVL